MTIPHTRAKHSKGRKDGQRPLGHARWARAAANAALRPNSKSARLYLKRVTLAYSIAEAVREGTDVHGLSDRTPFVHRDTYWDGRVNKATGTFVTRKSIRQVAVTCGVHCMVMQSQLAGNLSALLNATLIHPDTGVEMKRIEAVDRKSVRKGTRCKVCDSTIRR